MGAITYRGYRIRVEAETLPEGHWVGRGVVLGPNFTATLPCTGPFPSEAAALDAITSAGLRWVDERRERDEEGSGPALNGTRT